MTNLITSLIALPAFLVIVFYFFWVIYGSILHLFFWMRKKNGKDGKELMDRLKRLTKLLQEGSEKLYEISEAKAYNPRFYLAKAILDDMVGKYEELGRLFRGIDAKKEEIFNGA